MENKSAGSCCTEYLRVARLNFNSVKSYVERSLEQLEDADLHISCGGETNTIAVLLQHISGNLVSRFTGFLSSDGEKPGRNRDEEFVDHNTSKSELLKKWEAAWQVLFSTLDTLEEEDLMKTVYIRKEAHTAMEAINRQVWHYAFHAGQVVARAKEIKGDKWKNLSIPKKKQ